MAQAYTRSTKTSLFSNLLIKADNIKNKWTNFLEKHKERFPITVGLLKDNDGILMSSNIVLTSTLGTTLGAVYLNNLVLGLALIAPAMPVLGTAIAMAYDIEGLIEKRIRNKVKALKSPVKWTNERGQKVESTLKNRHLLESFQKRINHVISDKENLSHSQQKRVSQIVEEAKEITQSTKVIEPDTPNRHRFEFAHNYTVTKTKQKSL